MGRMYFSIAAYSEMAEFTFVGKKTQPQSSPGDCRTVGNSADLEAGENGIFWLAVPGSCKDRERSP